MRISDWSSDVCSSDRPPEFNRRPICGRLWGGEIPSLSLVSRHDGQIGKEQPKNGRERPLSRVMLNLFQHPWPDLSPCAAPKERVGRSEEGRVGNGWVSRGNSGWAAYHEKKKKK